MKFSELFTQFKDYLKGILDPSGDREGEAQTVENICSGINFKGSNPVSYTHLRAHET